MLNRIFGTHTPLLEVGYRLFLPIRPYLSKTFGKLKS